MLPIYNNAIAKLGIRITSFLTTSSCVVGVGCTRNCNNFTWSTKITTVTLCINRHLSIKSNSLEVELGPKQFGTRRPTPSIAATDRKIQGLKNMAAQEEVISSALKPETSDNIIWIDCEMTDLDVHIGRILEVACIITDPNLNEIARQPNIVINVGEEALSKMGAWCVHHHNESGLTEDCRKSSITLTEAEQILLDFVSKYTEPGRCPVGGNSLYLDRVFLQHYMPKLYTHFHYRSIDVSSIKELCRRWFPTEYYRAPKKRFVHRTIEDIEDTIAELKYYKEKLFNSK